MTNDKVKTIDEVHKRTENIATSEEIEKVTDEVHKCTKKIKISEEVDKGTEKLYDMKESMVTIHSKDSYKFEGQSKGST